MTTLIVGTQSIITGTLSTSVHKRTLLDFGSRQPPGMDCALVSQNIWSVVIHGSTLISWQTRPVRMLEFPMTAQVRSMQIFISRLMVILRLPILRTRLSGGKNSGSCESVTYSNDMSQICFIQMEPCHS